MTEDTPQAEVVIVGDDGTEHVFPAGFDPKKAASIVRGAPPKELRASESASRRPAVAMGWQAPGTFQTTDSPDQQEGIVSRTAKALAPMAQPESAGDLVGLALPSTVGMGAIKMGIPKGAAMMEKLGPKIAEAGDALKKHGPIAALIDVMTTHNPLQAAGVAAAPYGLEWVGRTMSRVGNAVRNFKPWEIDLNPGLVPEGRRLPAHPDESFVRGVSAQWGEQPSLPPGPRQMPSGRPDPSFVRAEPGQYARPERTALPPGARQMPPGADPSFVRGVPGEYPESVLRGEPVGVRPSTPRGPIIEGEILNGGALPPRRGTPMGASTKPDPSFVRAEPAQYATREKPVPRGELPPARRGIEMGPSTTNDPSFVRAEPAQVAQVERSGPPSLKQEVERLSGEGLDAKTIADRLKDHPELAKATSKQERTNLVREARGGPSGQIPARAKAAIDEAIGNLKTIEEKRAYLMRAPNGQVYDYVKAKLGL